MRLLSEYWEKLMDQHSEFQAPFICNIEFTAPSRFTEANKKVVSKNVNHINYIGTRPGVETLEESKTANKDELDLDKYFKYMDERPGSHGLFSSSDEMPNVKDVQNEVEEHKGVIWRVVLSLTEEDAKRLDYTSRERWETTLRATVPEAAAKMGIGETNLRWVAAFHKEADHPHVHLVMWEKKPKRRRGVLSSAEIRDVKKTFQNLVYADERASLFQQKTMARDLIRDLSKNELMDVVKLVREIQEFEKDLDLEQKRFGEGKVGIAPKFYDPEAKELSSQLREIASLLPKRGRLALQYMPTEVKETVATTTEWLIKQPSFYDAIRRYYGAVESMTRQYSFKEADIDKALKNAREDIEKRVSQVVLRAAAETKKKSYSNVSPENAVITVKKLSEAMGRPIDDQPKRVIEEASASLNRLGVHEQTQYQIFSDWQSKAELNITSAEIDDIVDRVKSEQPVDSINRKKDIDIYTRILKLAGRSDENIKYRLNIAGVPEADMDGIISKTESIVKESSTTFLKENEWKRLSENMGLTVEFPWKEVEQTYVIPENRNAVLQEFTKGTFNPDVNEGEKGYTAFCMTVALKQMHFSKEERSQIIKEFASRNSIGGIQKILDSVNKVETNYLKMETWSRISKNLNAELKYPWQTSKELELDKDMFKEAVNEFKSATKNIESPEEAKWTAETLIGFLKAEYTADEIKEDITAWAERTNALNQPQIEELDFWKKRTEDIQAMSKLFGIVDSIKETVSQFTRVLVAAGLNHEQLVNVIKDWNQRSGANIDETKLDKIIDGTEKTCRDAATWGRPPYVKKKDFDNLCKTLGVDAPYMWQGNRQGSQQDPSLNLAKKAWSGVWQAIEQERMKNQAEGEMLQRQAQRRQQRAAQKQQEEEN